MLGLSLLPLTGACFSGSLADRRAGQQHRGRTGWQPPHMQPDACIWLGNSVSQIFTFLFFQTGASPLHWLKWTLLSINWEQTHRKSNMPFLLPFPFLFSLCLLSPDQSHICKNRTGLDSISKFLTPLGLKECS